MLAYKADFENKYLWKEAVGVEEGDEDNDSTSDRFVLNVFLGSLPLICLTFRNLSPLYEPANTRGFYV